MLQPKLVLRLMAEVPTAAEAEAVVSAAVPLLEPHAAVDAVKIQTYWKMPECQEITLTLRPRGTADAAYDGVKSLAAAGWTGDDGEGPSPERWAVWNPEAGAVLVSPRVVWAHLDLFYTDPGAPPEELEYEDLDAPP